MDVNDNSPSSMTKKNSPQLTLRIKSSGNSTKDLTVSTEQNATVEQLKEKIHSALGTSSQRRYLRLISSGRLMAPDTAGLDVFKLEEGSVVHAVLSVAGVRGGQQELLSRASSSTPRTRYRGSGVGPDGLVLPRSNDNDSDNDDLEEGAERLGFDRLRSEGLTRNEVMALRIYFSRQVTRYNNQQQQHQSRSLPQDEENSLSTTDNNVSANLEAGRNIDPSVDPEDARIERLRMEDRWMEAQGPHSEFRLNLNANNPLLASHLINLQSAAAGNAPGTNEVIIGNFAGRTILGTDRDFFWGFVLGYSLGLMMMFWVWMPTVPHKQKMGILTGLCFQMTVKLLNATDEFSEE